MGSAGTWHELEQAGRLIEQHVRPEGDFDGWDGRAVLCHLAAYARVVGAILRATAEDLSYVQALALWRALHAEALAQLARLSDAQVAAPGPSSPPNWSRPHLAEVVTALTDHYAAHMAANS